MDRSTLFFDVGNVMIFFSYEKMIRKIAEVFDTTAKQVHNFILENGLQEKYELGHISTKEFHTAFCNHFHKKIGLKDLVTSLNHTFSPNKEIIPILEKLKSKKHKLVILSNTCASHFDYLVEKYSFLNLFDESILSHKVKLRKPDPKIYKLALSKATDKAFFTDDLKDNVQAANSAGLDSVVFTNTEELKNILLHRGFL